MRRKGNHARGVIENDVRGGKENNVHVSPFSSNAFDKKENYPIQNNTGNYLNRSNRHSFQNTSSVRNNHSHLIRNNLNSKLSQDKDNSTNSIDNFFKPSIILFIFVLLHILTWVLVTFYAYQTSVVTSIYGVVTTLISLDPGNWLYQSWEPTWSMVVLLCTFIFVGRVLILALVFSLWPKISDFLTMHGRKYRFVTSVNSS